MNGVKQEPVAEEGEEVSDVFAAADDDEPEVRAKAKEEREDEDFQASREDKEAVKALEAISHEERYSRLMELLGKSKFYSEYLMKKMAAEDEATVLKEKKAEDRRRRKEAEAAVEAEGATKKGRKGRGGGGGRAARAKAEQAKQREEARKRKADEMASPPPKKPENSCRSFGGEEVPDDQPLLLTGGVMRDYQIRGYQWMATLFENGINGILADEMGLGKTIQTIALFCHLVEMGVPGPFLIVAPLSTVPNWVKEFKRFAPSMPVVLYHGSQKEREALRRDNLSATTAIDGIEGKVRSVFVTSYEIAMNDRSHFYKVMWRYIVVDEGHRLKNMNCRLIRELKQYGSVNRLLLTGTPLQNNLAELWSLLNFLMAEIFDDLSVFESWFNAKDMDENTEEASRILAQEKQNNILSTLHQILTPFLLRRVKSDVDLKIPPKKEILVYCPMAQKQRDYYEASVNRTLADLVGKKKDGFDESVKFEDMGRGKRKKDSVDYSIFLGDDGVSERKLEEYVSKVSEMSEKRGSMGTKGAYEAELERAHLTSDCRVSLKNRMMDLRKATNHPYLIDHPLTEDGCFYQADQDMIDCCGKLKVLDRLLGELMDRGHKTLIFSQMTRMLDILGDYLNFKGVTFSRLDGMMHFEDRQQNIDDFNEKDEVKVFLLSTRAGGLGINLTAADTCIIYDSDWNPQQDLQAQDRCHRIGQTKPVMVYRLVTAGTIDQKVVERAAAKRRLEKMIIHSKKFKSQDQDGLKKTMEAISPQELLDLLHSHDHVGKVDRSNGEGGRGSDGGDVFSEEEMEALMDRSDLRWRKDKDSKNQSAPKVGKRARLANGGTHSSSQEKGSGGAFKVIDLEEESSTLELKSVKEE